MSNLISEDVLKGKQAQYGKEIMEWVADILTAENGTGFEVKNLCMMMKFAGFFPDFEIVAPAVRQ